MTNLGETREARSSMETGQREGGWNRALDLVLGEGLKIKLQLSPCVSKRQAHKQYPVPKKV